MASMEAAMQLTPGQRDLALTLLRAHAAETRHHLRLARMQLGDSHRQVGQLAHQAQLAESTVAAVTADSPVTAAA